MHALRNRLTVAKSAMMEFYRRGVLASMPRAVVLAYHRVASPKLDPLGLCVSRLHFEEQMELLAREFRPYSLTALEEMRGGRLPERCVAITFDDGYADNLVSALPILRKYNIPATIFVAPGLSDDGSVSDFLRRILLESPRLPNPIEVHMDDRTMSWDLGIWSTLPDSLDQAYGRWIMGEQAPTPRHQAFLDLHRILRPMDEMHRRNILEQIKAALLIPDRSPMEDRFLRPGEIAELSRDPLMEIGAHSMHHLVLSQQTPENQSMEIQTSKKQLEDIVGKALTSFAYPYGSAWDVSWRTVELVREAGFHMACANMPGQLTARTNPYWIPRWIVRDWGQADFRENLKTFFAPTVLRPPVGKVTRPS